MILGSLVLSSLTTRLEAEKFKACLAEDDSVLECLGH